MATRDTANELLRDAILRHQIGIRKYQTGLLRRVANILETADRDLVEQLRTRLARFEGKPIDWRGESWQTLLKDIRAARDATMTAYQQMATPELQDFSKLEGAREVSILQSAIPIETQVASVTASQLRAIVTSRPFQGKLMKDWFTDVALSDRRRLSQAIQLGMVEGQPIDDIVRRVVGTKANDFGDGILSVTRRDAQAIVRTAVNHISNAARQDVWEANADIIQARVWVSTLDGRTTAICQARDGHGTPVGDNKLPDDIPPLDPPSATPPAHINCRSTMVAVIDGVGLLGSRPTVTDTRTRDKREVDFRRIARETKTPIKQVRADWAAKNIGRAPATTNYQEFLTRQSATFQNEVLGPTKAELFRTGKINVDQFVDRAGHEYTLAQLAETRPEVFRAAGLDPASF